MNRVLFLGLSRRSTGEVTYIVQQLINLGIQNWEPELLIHRELSSVGVLFQGKKSTHDLSQSKFPERREFLKEIFTKNSVVLVIDWNSFLLETNVTPAEKQILETDLNQYVQDGTRLGFIDYFSSFFRDPMMRMDYLTAAQEGLKRKTEGLPLTHRLVYYVRKFVPLRMELQLSTVPRSIEIFRPVPLNIHGGTEGVRYYKNLFPEVHPRKNPEFILLGLSRFFEFSVDRKILEKLWGSLLIKIIETFPHQKVQIIDPFNLSWPQEIQDRIQVSSWLSREELDDILSRSLFVGLMVPYGTLGTMALQRGIPFVSFYSSQSTEASKAFAGMIPGIHFPGFNALGVWEDEGFLGGLMQENSYFSQVLMADLARVDLWQTLAPQIRKSYDHPESLERVSKLGNLPGLGDEVTKWLAVSDGKP